jgi:lipopolysaccharide transport system permease protein
MSELQPLTPGHYITLLDTLARFELKADARRYYLGYLWWVLEPMLYVAVFYLVFVKLLDNRQPDFLVFLAVGKLAFIWFSKSVNQAGISLIQNRGLIAQVDLPKHLFPMTVLHEGLYRQLAVFAFLIFFIALAGFMPTALWWWLVPLAVIQYVLIIGCSLLAALLVCVRRDFQLLIQLGTVFLLFMSGVFWDVRSISDPELAYWLQVLNPLVILLDSYRQVLLWGQAPDVSALLWVCTESVVLLLSALYLYRRLHYWLAIQAITQ